MNILLIILFALGSVFFLLGAALLAVAVISRRKAEASRGWPTTPGRILSTSLDSHTNYDTDNTPSTTFKPVVNYQYKVMGIEYTGGKIAHGATSFNRSQAEQILNRYNATPNPTVYYNPQNPSEAVLETEAAGSKVFLIVGAAFMALGIIGWCATSILLLANAV